MTSKPLQSDIPETPETRETWKARKLPMQWSIYSGTPGDLTMDTPMDLSAPEGVPDGIYTVVNHSNIGAEFAEKTTIQEGFTVGIGEAHGLEIQNGRFVPEPTARACFEALCISQGIDPSLVPQGVQVSDHIFIEEFDFDPESRKFIVGLGS